MARYKHYDLNQTKMITLPYADQIVEGSFEYALNEIVEEQSATDATFQFKNCRGMPGRGRNLVYLMDGSLAPGGRSDGMLLLADNGRCPHRLLDFDEGTALGGTVGVTHSLFRSNRAPDHLRRIYRDRARVGRWGRTIEWTGSSRAKVLRSPGVVN